MAECPRHGVSKAEMIDAPKATPTAAITRRLHAAARNRYNPASRPKSYWRWCYLPELRVGDRRLDGWAIRKSWTTGEVGFERHALEVKATRADWRKECRDLMKGAAAMMVSNRAYVVAPAKLIAPEELPEGWGLIEVILSRSCDRTRLMVEAPYREVDPPGLEVICELARRASV